MLSRIKPGIEKRSSKFIKKIDFVDPYFFNFLGLAGSILFVIFLVEGVYLWALLSLVLATADALDGMVARSSKNVTDFGGVIDSTFDRISDTLYVSAFGFSGLVQWWLVVGLLATSYMTSYIRSRTELAARGSFKLDIGWIERPERIILILFAVIMLLLDKRIWIPHLFGVMFLLSTITVIQRLIAAKRRLD